MTATTADRPTGSPTSPHLLALVTRLIHQLAVSDDRPDRDLDMARRPSSADPLPGPRVGVSYAIPVRWNTKPSRGLNDCASTTIWTGIPALPTAS